MAVETKYDKSHHAGGTPEARINARLRNSGAGAFPDTTVQNGSSAQRVFHNVHLAGHRPNPGTAARECGPQEQFHHDEATTQATTYFTGHKGGGE